jgi:threonine synthase
MAREFIHKYNGELLTVTDDQILEASMNLAMNTGIFAEPAAAAAFAGFYSYYQKNMLPENSINVVLLTGSGLKDLKATNEILKIPEAISPELNQLKKVLS